MSHDALSKFFCKIFRSKNNGIESISSKSMYYQEDHEVIDLSTDRHSCPTFVQNEIKTRREQINYEENRKRASGRLPTVVTKSSQR